MSAERDLAEAIHHEIIAPERVDAALDLWRHRQVGASDRADMWRVLALTSSAAIEAVLARRQSDAARTGPWREDADMRERIAAAIYNINPIGKRPWRDAPASVAEDCRACADAAVAAVLLARTGPWGEP